MTDVVSFISNSDNNTGKMFLAVDFDGVIHITDYDNYGDYKTFSKVMPGAVKYMKKLKEEGWHITIWTCRKESVEMVLWLRANGIPFDAINKNPSPMNGSSQKIYADAYLDDRNIEAIGHPFYQWGDVYRMIRKKFDTYYRGNTIRRNW